MEQHKVKTVKLSKAHIIRAVASSTAIETGQSVQAIEAKLKTKSDKFKDLSLAL